MSSPVLTRRQLNRTFLARQLLLALDRRSPAEAIEWLVGLQGQTPIAPYVALWSRLEGFDPMALSRLIEEREAVRIGLFRTTIHLVTTRDALRLRPVLQDVLDRAWRSSPFARQLADLDLAAVLARSRELLEAAPRGPAELGRLLAEEWPGRDQSSLAYASRFLLPLVQVPPRGLWGRTSATRNTTLEAWAGRPMATDTAADDAVLRYLAAFGPASVGDIRIWSWMVGVREIIDRLRPRLRTYRDERGRELFDLADAPLTDPDVPAPPRFLPDYDNLVLSHEDRARVMPEVIRQNVTWAWGALLVDGFVAATWKPPQPNGPAAIDVRTFAPLPASDASAVVEEGKRLLTLLAPERSTGEVRITVDADQMTGRVR